MDDAVQAHLQTLTIRVEELRDAVTTLESRLMERCPNHQARLHRLETILDGPPGNGRSPGLIARIGVVEDVVRRTDRIRAWLYSGAGAAAGGILAVLLEKLL